MSDQEQQKFEFDKFMDEIIIKERATQKRDVKDGEMPLKQRDAQRRENPLNLIKWGNK